MKKHKMQNIIFAEDKIIRFQENKIVSLLLQESNYDLNSLTTVGFKKKDWQQFMQLIGYSVSAYGGLGIVSEKLAIKADKKADKLKKKMKRLLKKYSIKQIEEL